MMASLMSSICALMVTKNRYPINYVTLAIFVFVMSVEVGTVCALFSEIGLGDKIVQAAGLTAIIFLSLSAYAHISQKDFSFMGQFLFMAILANFLVGLVGFFTGSSILSTLY